MQKNYEEGQAHLLALCLSLPIVILLVLFICQTAWVAYQQVSLDHALLNVGRSLDNVARTALTGAGDMDCQLKEAILADWTHLDADSLTVSQTDCELSSIADSNCTIDDGDTDYGAHSYGQERSYLRIQSQVSYEVKSLFPLPWTGDITLQKTLDRTHMLSMRFEVDADV